MDRYIAFDVETPSNEPGCMSAIGIAVIENARIIETCSTLVNPESYFAWFNIQLTGITPEAVADAPTFPELWAQYGDLLQSGILLAHNASFDMRVLSSCLSRYALPAPAELRYACTVQMGRRCYPDLPNHRLDTLCRARGICLNHHRADSDACACAALFLDYLSQGLDPAPFLRRYDLRAGRTIR